MLDIHFLVGFMTRTFVVNIHIDCGDIKVVLPVILQLLLKIALMIKTGGENKLTQLKSTHFKI